MSDVGDGLRSTGLHDGGRLPPGERKAVLDALASLRFDGHPAYVAVVDGDPRPSRALWDELGLDGQRDLLLIVGDGRWEARGWGLDDAEIAQILDDAEPWMAKGVGPAVTEALGGLSTAGAPAAVEWLGVGAAGVGVAAVAAGIGWLVARRNRVGAVERKEREARASVEEAVAHLVLTADGLGERGRALQDRADRLRRELRNIPASDPHEVRVARMVQLENEVVALQSEVLQAENRSAAGQATTEGRRQPPPLRETE